MTDEHTTFQPEEIQAMSVALETACNTLGSVGRDRNVIAERIIALARTGVIDAKALSDRVVAEVKAMRSL
jgi:hypothetical protein